MCQAAVLKLYFKGKAWDSSLSRRTNHRRKVPIHIPRLNWKMWGIRGRRKGVRRACFSPRAEVWAWQLAVYLLFSLTSLFYWCSYWLSTMPAPISSVLTLSVLSWAPLTEEGTGRSWPKVSSKSKALSVLGAGNCLDPTGPPKPPARKQSAVLLETVWEEVGGGEKWDREKRWEQTHPGGPQEK